MKGRKQKMEEYIQKYNKWLADPVIDEKSKKELKAIEGNEEEIKENQIADINKDNESDKTEFEELFKTREGDYKEEK